MSFAFQHAAASMSTSEPYAPAHNRGAAGSANASVVERAAFHLLGAVALIYGFLCGLRTVADPDLFWHLATARWVTQHHQVFSNDVFSFTAAGQPWVYPVGECLFFYAAYRLGGYVLLSWIGAFGCVTTLALLLRKGRAATAALAVLAAPIVASRTGTRAELFTTVLFAAYVSILWENYQGGKGRLWLLPPLMILWVNCHLGFVAGLALFAAFIGIDTLELLQGEVRWKTAMQRLKRELPVFAVTAVSTLLNPWGWKIYQALARQNRAMAEHSLWIVEWGRIPLGWSSISQGLVTWDPNPIYVLLVVVVVASVYALARRRFGSAILLVSATYPSLQHSRVAGLTSCVIVVVGGRLLSSAIEEFFAWPAQPRIRQALAIGAAAAVVIYGATRAVQVGSVHETSLASFGAGPSWWFPERATDYIKQANLPSEIFNTYIQGGYLIWKLGPERRVYIDGRAIPYGVQAFALQAEMLQNSPDSPVWLAEANHYRINTVILPTNRFEGDLGILNSFCHSSNWRPVYLDRTAGVFVRWTPENENVIRQANLNCATVPIPAKTISGSKADRFNQWADSASVLAALGRYPEALEAAKQAEEAFPESAFVPWLRGNIHYFTGLYAEAERDYKTAISIAPEFPLYWFSLAVAYKRQGRIPETIQAQRHAIDISTMPQPAALVKLARLYLDTQQPRQASETFNEAVRSASPELLAARGPFSLSFQADQGRAAAWRALGDTKRAAEFDQQAVQDLLPRD